MSPPNRTNRNGTGTRRLWAEALPIAAAVGAYGLSYGVLAVAAGLHPLLAVGSSVAVLAGGSQFAFVGVLAAGGHPMAGAVSGLLLNVRYAAFGLAIARRLPGGPWWRRATDGYLVLDESVGLALGAEADGADAAAVTRRFRTLGVAVTAAWIAATAIGAYGGALLGDPEAFGLDAAFPAGFLALLAPWLRSPAGRRAGLAGAGLAVALTPFVPPGVPLLAASLGVLAAWKAPRADGAPRTPEPSADEEARPW
ncbi:branched-chain amino acid ABC transporter permease [Nitriliruptoraceae bacterium ZYF776]|nr:branched-chain amino acid ABC transporter permease [Profundirhabdus halotolerans]